MNLLFVLKWLAVIKMLNSKCLIETNHVNEPGDLVQDLVRRLSSVSRSNEPIPCDSVLFSFAGFCHLN